MQGRERETGVIRTQWLELGSTSLIGKRILLVDEVGLGALYTSFIITLFNSLSFRCVFFVWFWELVGDAACSWWTTWCELPFLSLNCCPHAAGVWRGPAAAAAVVAAAAVAASAAAFAAAAAAVAVAAAAAAAAAVGAAPAAVAPSPALAYTEGMLVQDGTAAPSPNPTPPPPHSCSQVDDSRQTLAYAVRELQADIAAQAAALTAAGEAVPTTQLGVYVLHNKQRPKKGTLPEGVPQFVAQVGGWAGGWG